MNNFNCEDIIRLILGYVPPLNKNILSCWRNDDKNPGCRFRYSNDGKLHYFDSKDNVRHGQTMLKLYQIEYNMDYLTAIKDIKKRLNIKEDVPIRYRPKLVELERKVKITPKRKAFSEVGKKYWNDLGVKSLSGIFEVKSVVYETDESIREVAETQLAFTYLFDLGEWKLYRPFSTNKKDKWLGTVKNYNCMTLLQGSNTVLICKATKDFKVIESICLEYGFKVDLYHLQSEKVADNKSQIPNYSKLKLYDRVITILDHDSVGIESGKVFKKHLNADNYYTTGAKDVADYYLAFGREKTAEWLKTVLKLE